MSGDRWQRLEALFHAALPLPPDARALLLDRECREDPALRAEVERLLAAHERAGGFIEAPAVTLADMEREERVVGRRIGAYRVVRELGRGGMGAVYLAERADGFLVSDYGHRWEEGIRRLAGLLGEGRLRYREDVTEGLEHAPQAFIGMLNGANRGKTLVRIS